MSSSSKAETSRFAIFALAVLLVSGCAAVKPSEQGIVADAAQKPDEGIVFGILNAISYDSKGNKHTTETGPNISYGITFGPSSSVLAQRFTPFAAAVQADRVVHGQTKFPEVFFAKRLPAGTYYIYEVYRSTPAGSGSVSLEAHFTVTPNKATYIGSIQVEFHGARGLLGDERSAQRATIRVTNEFDKAAQQYKERNPRLPFELATSLMTVSR